MRTTNVAARLRLGSARMRAASGIKGLTVRQIMTTAVLAVRAEDTLENALAEMKQTDLRYLPVVDRDGHLVGMLSDSDIARAGGELERVAEAMTTELVTTRPELPAFEAATVMIERRVKALPVVNSEAKLVGLLTETDYLVVAEQLLKKGF